eukprot:TRINITY_DN75032_c0_g1_i1.p1 TRINITY_DN75032_c0_g1~~TRINITY_DN75032_c0_g1_i1.p1  ORF type:complete len:405 (-),score=116.14 TRINITY_DN75032_c0_g1_i1:232-1293(-)
MTDPLRHAMGLRSAQDQCKMRMWNGLPQLFQNTIFHGEQDPAIKALRHGGSLEERLQRARELKDEGNSSLKAANSAAPREAPAAVDASEARAARERERELEGLIAAKERELLELRRELKALRAQQASQASASSAAAIALADDDFGSAKGFEAAITSYEKAAGILRYVECTRSDWKNDDGSYKGIEDEHLMVDSSALEGDDPEAEAARELVTSCYLNIALANQKLGRYDQMRAACDEVLDKVNPRSVKALYRRAQARIAPVKALDADRDAAIRDLQAAAQLAPQDKDVRGLLARLKAERKAQEAEDKNTFAGLFDRGEVGSGNPRSVQEPRKPLDLRDPKVQAMLDVRPGPMDI